MMMTNCSNLHLHQSKVKAVTPKGLKKQSPSALKKFKHRIIRKRGKNMDKLMITTNKETRQKMVQPIHSAAPFFLLFGIKAKYLKHMSFGSLILKPYAHAVSRSRKHDVVCVLYQKIHLLL